MVFSPALLIYVPQYFSDSYGKRWQKYTFIPGICYLTLTLLSFNKMFMLSTQVLFFSFFREILYMGEIPTLSTGNRL